MIAVMCFGFLTKLFTESELSMHIICPLTWNSDSKWLVEMTIFPCTTFFLGSLMLFISEGQRTCNKRNGLWSHAGHFIYVG